MPGYRRRVKLAGYTDRGVDGSPMLTRPGFWAVHLLPVLEAELDEEYAELFGVGVRDMRGTYRRLTDDAAWPVFPVPLGDGQVVAAVYRNVVEEEDLDFLLVPQDGSDCVALAVPGLSWAQLCAAAERADDPATALLLLAPALGDDAALEPSVVAALTGALNAVGVAGDAEEIATRMAGALLR